MPQQPAVAAVRAIRADKIRSLFMTVSNTKQNRWAAMGKHWVEQLYTTPGDVQPPRAGIFFATHFFFATHAGRTGGMVSQDDSASRAEKNSADCKRRLCRTCRMFWLCDLQFNRLLAGWLRGRRLLHS